MSKTKKPTGKTATNLGFDVLSQNLGKKFDIVNGQKVMPGWGKKLDQAQKFRIISNDLPGQFEQKSPTAYIRVRHQGSHVCGDCAADPGQLHVPGCDVEKCPKCKGQLISCGCFEKWLNNYQD